MSYNLQAILLSLVTLSSAHNIPGVYGPGGIYGPGGEYGPGGVNGPDGEYGPGYGGRGGASPYFGFTGVRLRAFLNDREKIIIAHGVLAALAFVVFFPVGSILIRLGAFRGLWLVHGLLQIFAYLVYTAAFGIGVWMVQEMPFNLLDSYHPIIGIVVFVLLFFQPFLGAMHHVRFKSLQRRTVWSYAHVWLGRILITLGIINGGLGLLLATQTGFFVPSRAEMIAYGVIAALMWLVWVASAIIGENRRARGTQFVHAEPAYKEQYS